MDANHKDNLGHTALLRAALQGHEEVVRLLLDDDKVDPNTEIAEGWTALLVIASEPGDKHAG